MRINARSTAIVAGAALLMSLLIGIIGGVPFGVLLLRGLFISVLFGAGAIGVGYVVDRFLPELREMRTSVGPEQTGGRVDIVVDDDPLAGDELPAQLPEDAPPDQDETDSRPREERADSSTEDLEELPADGEEASGDGPTFRPGIASAQAAGGRESGDEVEELAEAADEELPDMDRMSDSFVAPIDGAEGVGVDDSVDAGGDPSMIAQAIRTVLKREEG